jgi:hypothetical protein
MLVQVIQGITWRTCFSCFRYVREVAMLRYVKDEEGLVAAVKCTLDGPMAVRIKELARESGTTAAIWVREALEYMLMEHRAGRYRPDPDRHWARNGDDAEHVVDL